MTTALDFVVQKKAKQAKIDQGAKELAIRFQKILNDQSLAPTKNASRTKKRTVTRKAAIQTEAVQAELEAVGPSTIQEAFEPESIEVISSDVVDEITDLSDSEPQEIAESASPAAANKPTKFIWWINKDQYSVVATMTMDKRLKEKVQKLRKVSDGGWLINEGSCIQHDESPSLSGIVINLKQKEFLRKKNFPGEVVAQA